MFFSTASQLRREMAECVGGFVQVNKRWRQKIKIILLQWQKLKPFKYIFLPADSAVEPTENIFSWRKTFIKVKAPFAGHPAASSAWLPAVILSLRGGLESHCNKETQWHLVRKQSQVFVICEKTRRWKVKGPEWFRLRGHVLTGVCCSVSRGFCSDAFKHLWCLVENL